MKRRKNLLLSSEAIARGQQVAQETGRSLSAVVEEQLLSIRIAKAGPEDYWSGPALRPVQRAEDERFAYLRRKHG